MNPKPMETEYVREELAQCLTTGELKQKILEHCHKRDLLYLGRILYTIVEIFQIFVQTPA